MSSSLDPFTNVLSRDHRCVSFPKRFADGSIAFIIIHFPYVVCSKPFSGNLRAFRCSRKYSLSSMSPVKLSEDMFTLPESKLLPISSPSVLNSLSESVLRMQAEKTALRDNCTVPEEPIKRSLMTQCCLSRPLYHVLVRNNLKRHLRCSTYLETPCLSYSTESSHIASFVSTLFLILRAFFITLQIIVQKLA